MNNLVRFVVAVIIFSIIFSSCTMQKRRYSKGYHVTWHKKKSKRPNGKITQINHSQNQIKVANQPDLKNNHKTSINYDSFTAKYPKSTITRLKFSKDKDFEFLNNSIQIQPVHADTQVTLTPVEIENGYFMNAHGQKRKYRRGLKNLLTILGIIISVIGLFALLGGYSIWLVLGITLLIIGAALPKPNKRSLIATESQLLKSKNDNKAYIATGISTVLIVGSILIGFVILFLIALA